jgi:dihydroflavonol-4-reductase
MSRVLVTGGNGFLGRHIVRELRADGHEITALLRAPSPEIAELCSNVVIGDILEKASIASAAKGCTILVHAAGKVSRNPDDAELLYRVHVEGTRNVLDAAAAAGITRAIVLSTSGVVAVSDRRDFIAREHDETPLSLIQRWPYYRSKLYAEKTALERQRSGFDVISLNPTLLLGPGDLLGSSTEDVRLFLDKKIPAVPPGGLSFVDVRDVARTVCSALERGRGGERYLLGAQNLTLREFFGRLERVSGVRAPKLPLPHAPELSRSSMRMLTEVLGRFGVRSPLDEVSADMAQFFWYLDASKAEDELGFAPRDAQETLADTVKDLRERGVVWPS